MFNFQSFFENAHTGIDSLITGNEMKNKLKGLTGLQDTYRFGKQGRGMFSQNLLNSLVDTNNPFSSSRGTNIEDMLGASLSMQLGKKRNLMAELFGSKGNIGFNLSGKF